MRNLIDALPRDSAYKRAVLGEHAHWTTDTYLLAAAVDHLGVLASEMRWKTTPERVPRPGDNDVPPVAPVSAVDVRAELEARRAAAEKKRKPTKAKGATA